VDGRFERIFQRWVNCLNAVPPRLEKVVIYKLSGVRWICSLYMNFVLIQL